KISARRAATLTCADPHSPARAGRADIHLQMQPGTDVALYSAMLQHILAQSLENRAFLAERTHDFEKVRAAVQPYTPERAAKITGVPADVIRRAAETDDRGPDTPPRRGVGRTRHAPAQHLRTAPRA